MASKTITFSLSEKSIDKAIKELEEYQEWIRNKSVLLISRLAALGRDYAEANKYSEGDTNANAIHADIGQIEYNGNKVRIPLRLSPLPDAAFIEFGAGVHYNTEVGTSPNPWGASIGYVIGSYGYGQGAKDFWYYRSDGGAWVKSHGTKAAMPLYKAEQEIIAQVDAIAREVFG